MMRPQLALRIIGNAMAVVWKADDRLMAITASHRAAGKSAMGATCWMPALLTRMSQAPAVSIRRLAASASARSAWT